MIIQQFLGALFDSPEYRRINYDTLYMLRILPVMVDGIFGIRRGFALASGANINVPHQSIGSPFCDCLMLSNDLRLVWRNPLPKYGAQSNSITSLARTVLRDKYVADLNFDRYVEYIDRLTRIDYVDLMEMIEEKMTSGPVALSSAEKAKLLEVLFFFNGVPSPLVNYYDTEGKYLADWLKRNCL
jgi:hypothetical protein